MARIATWLLLLLVAAPAAASAPIRVVEDSLEVPPGLEAEAALASVADVADIFSAYDPVVPKIPGVRLELEKQVLSAASPVVMELPVEGSAFGRDIDERARVTAHSTPAPCGAAGEGVQITLDFESSSHNIERRIDRIEITACPRVGDDGVVHVDAVGKMFEGHTPEDPELNAINEAIGSRALQGAFIKQVPAVFSAVETHWAELEAEPDAP